MQNIRTIGLDLAKRVFQLHGMDHEGRTVLRKKVRRGQVVKVFATLPPCLVGMEACGSVHYWAREISDQGHHVRLIPPQYVRPSHKLSTTDPDFGNSEARVSLLLFGLCGAKMKRVSEVL